MPGEPAKPTSGFARQALNQHNGGCGLKNGARPPAIEITKKAQ